MASPSVLDAILINLGFTYLLLLVMSWSEMKMRPLILFVTFVAFLIISFDYMLSKGLATIHCVEFEDLSRQLVTKSAKFSAKQKLPWTSVSVVY